MMHSNLKVSGYSASDKNINMDLQAPLLCVFFAYKLSNKTSIENPPIIRRFFAALIKLGRHQQENRRSFWSRKE